MRALRNRVRRFVRPVWRVFFVLLFFGLVVLTADSASAQQISLDLGEGGTVTGRVVQLVVFLTIITLAPSLLIMVTSFTRIVVVLSILRTAIGTQQTPPNSVLVSLALFMTFFVMQPALEAAWQDGVRPLINEEISEQEAYERTSTPMREFMLKHVQEKDLLLFFDLGEIEPPQDPQQTSMRVLVPAFYDF